MAIRVEKECHKTSDVERKKVITDAKDASANVKRAFRILKFQVLRIGWQCETESKIVTECNANWQPLQQRPKLQKRRLLSRLNPLKRHFSNTQGTESAVQQHLKSKLEKDTHTIFNHPKQGIEV